jgi:3-oxoacyl-[acyl-carrier-protein] synthase-1
MLALPIAVTGLGLISSLGGAISACAATRAGVTRSSRLVFSVEDREALEMVAVSGRPVGDLTVGFSEVGLAVRLVSLALADLLSRTPLDSQELSHTPVLLNLPSGFYLEQAEEIERRTSGSVPPEPEPSALERFEATKPLYKSVIDKSFHALGLTPPSRDMQHVFFGDQAGIAPIIEMAQRLMIDDGVSACLVGGVDSLVDRPWLEACEALGILKTAVRPVGLIPGEAAAFLLVEGPRRGPSPRPPLGTLVACEAGRESGNRFSDRPPVGKVLSELIRRCVTSTPSSEPMGLVCDLNGDPARSVELGHVLVRLRPVITPTESVIPAMAFGDTRAASSFVGACVALRAFARGYAPGSAFLVVSMGDEGGRAAIVLSAGV